MSKLIFAGNWKMNMGPAAARDFLKVFLQRYKKESGVEVWIFPPASSIEAVAREVRDRPEIVVGAQHVYWEESGAFTGETSIPIIVDAGARAALVGHSERRHIFGETVEDTGRRARALLDAGLTPVFCVGEKLDQREAGHTEAVVVAQLGGLDGLNASQLSKIVFAYEPVWAIGTGKNATPADAAQVHAAIHNWMAGRGVARRDVTVLYGGSVKPENVVSLISEPTIDGVLVGGASLEAAGWDEIVAARPN